MKITEKEIKSYVDNDRDGKILTIDFGKKEFHYQPQGKDYSIKGFFENVEEWLESLIEIGEEKYQLANWWKDKNFIEWSLLQESEMEIKRETEKALLITNNVGTEVWIPKSVLKKIDCCEVDNTAKKMNYEEIKQKTKELVKRQGILTDKEIEKVEDVLIELIADASDGIGELVSHVEDVQIYDYTKRMIPLHSEPRRLQRILRNLRHELSRPEKVREIIGYNL